MNFKTLIALLAIFAVIMSASAVCAEDGDVGQINDDVTPTAADGTPADDETGEGEDDGAEEVTGDDEDAPNIDVGVNPVEDENSTDATAGGSETPLNNNTAGNPILVLLAALAVLGVIPFKRN